MNLIVRVMILLGSALMVVNIMSFIKFARNIQKKENWGDEKRILYVPIILLIFFLFGYLMVGLFGNPTLIMGGILFGGSIFVYLMYVFIQRTTDRIIENEQLEAKLMAAEESSKAKTAFLASVSHEMRTPMNVIIGLDTMALKAKDLSKETRGYLEKIGASASHLLDLINNLLDMNSIEKGELKIEPEPFLLRDAASQLNSIAETLCLRKGLTYEFNGGECCDRKYIGDELRIKQVLLALLDNAISFTDVPGNVKFSISGNGESETETLNFTVTDTGRGIDPDFLPHIFEVFTREDMKSTASHGGSGLGLAVAKRMVDLLGGTISVDSVQGKGSTFTVTLPLRVAPVQDVPEEVPQDEVTLEGKRILIAEDIPENAEIVMDLLELEGAESEHAENGRIALEMFNASEPGYYDAILMDLRMPEMDGLTAAREIRDSSHPGAKLIPIIALTANAYESDIKQSLEVGMNAHLAKPADADELYSALRKYMKGASTK